MEKFLTKLTSRKFIATATTIITTIAAMSTGAINTETGVAAVLTAALSYLLVEGYVDAKRAAQITRTAATVAQTAATVLDEAANTIDKAAQP